MKSLSLVCAVAVGLAVTPAVALTEQECIAAWTKADTDRDGFLTEKEATRYFAALRVANKQVPNDRMTQAMFLEHCKADQFVAAKVDEGAPLSGANSFTENLAKDRAVAAGFLNVSTLTKDSNGVWRGTAMDGTKQVKISVDFKGNVVAQ